MLHAEVPKFPRSVTLLPVRIFRVLFPPSYFATCHSVAPLSTVSQLYNTYTCVWRTGNGFIVVVTQRDESLERYYVKLWKMFYCAFLARVISSNERRRCFTVFKIFWYHGLRNKICEKLIQGTFMFLAYSAFSFFFSFVFWQTNTHFTFTKFTCKDSWLPFSLTNITLWFPIHDLPHVSLSRQTLWILFLE